VEEGAEAPASVCICTGVPVKQANCAPEKEGQPIHGKREEEKGEEKHPKVVVHKEFELEDDAEDRH
jgi:hypothetical protein